MKIISIVLAVFAFVNLSIISSVTAQNVVPKVASQSAGTVAKKVVQTTSPVAQKANQSTVTVAPKAAQPVASVVPKAPVTDANQSSSLPSGGIGVSTVQKAERSDGLETKKTNASSIQPTVVKSDLKISTVQKAENTSGLPDSELKKKK